MRVLGASCNSSLDSQTDRSRPKPNYKSLQPRTPPALLLFMGLVTGRGTGSLQRSQLALELRFQKSGEPRRAEKVWPALLKLSSKPPLAPTLIRNAHPKPGSRNGQRNQLSCFCSPFISNPHLRH